MLYINGHSIVEKDGDASLYINSFPPGQNDRQFGDNIFECIFCE